MTKYNFKTIAFNWRWLKLLLPFWIILGGIPLILMGKQPTSVCLMVFAIALIPAITATIFCIRCFIYYLKDIDRQKRQLDALEKELSQLENDKPPTSQ